MTCAKALDTTHVVQCIILLQRMPLHWQWRPFIGWCTFEALLQDQIVKIAKVIDAACMWVQLVIGLDCCRVRTTTMLQAKQTALCKLIQSLFVPHSGLFSSHEALHVSCEALDSSCTSKTFCTARHTAGGRGEGDAMINLLQSFGEPLANI